MTVRWDPQTYLGYAAERARPFTDLLARVGGPASRPPWSTSAAGPVA